MKLFQRKYQLKTWYKCNIINSTSTVVCYIIIISWNLICGIIYIYHHKYLFFIHSSKADKLHSWFENVFLRNIFVVISCLFYKAILLNVLIRPWHWLTTLRPSILYLPFDCIWYYCNILTFARSFFFYCMFKKFHDRLVYVLWRILSRKVSLKLSQVPENCNDGFSDMYILTWNKSKPLLFPSYNMYIRMNCIYVNIRKVITASECNMLLHGNLYF